MPTLVRLLTAIAIIAAVVYAIMAALVFFVEPEPRQVVIDVPLRDLDAVEPAAEAAPTVPGVAPAVVVPAAGDPAAPAAVGGVTAPGATPAVAAPATAGAAAPAAGDAPATGAPQQ